MPFTAHVTDSEVQSLKDGLVKLIEDSNEKKTRVAWTNRYIGPIHAAGRGGGVTEEKAAT